MSDDYVEEAKQRLDEEVEYVLDSLRMIAEERFLEPDWGIQTFRDKFVYKTKNI